MKTIVPYKLISKRSRLISDISFFLAIAASFLAIGYAPSDKTYLITSIFCSLILILLLCFWYFSYDQISRKTSIPRLDYLLGVTHQPEDEREQLALYRAGFLAFHLMIRVSFIVWFITNSFARTFEQRALGYPVILVMAISWAFFAQLLRRYEVEQRQEFSTDGKIVIFEKGKKPVVTK